MMLPWRSGPGCCLCYMRLCVALRNSAAGAWSTETMVCRPKAFLFFVICAETVAWDV